MLLRFLWLDNKIGCVHIIKLYISNMDRAHRHNAEQQKPDTKEYRGYVSSYVKFKNRTNLWDGIRVLK